MSSETLRLAGRAVVAGDASGAALTLEEGLSFAMAVDVESGRISDVHSARVGESLVGRVLVMPEGRGSSSASTSLAEAIRLGTAPAAIVLGEVDQILAVGAIVARRLYGRTCPIVVLTTSDRDRIADGDFVTIRSDGSIVAASPSSAGARTRSREDGHARR